MNDRMILRVLSITLCLVAALMLPALLLALIWHEGAAAKGFAVTICLMLLMSLVTFLKPPRKTTLYAKDGFIIVALAWIMISLLGALPFVLSGEIPSYVDALFETVSGLTTTGASILENVEAMARSLLYWRSFTIWLGGMGVLVFLLAIASFGGSSGDSLFIMRAESPGPQVSKLVPKTMQTARILYTIYISMTFVQTALLILGGMPVFDSVLTAFATAGTGGFGIKADSMASYSPYLQWVITVFMALFGVNFGIYYLLLMRSFKRAALDEELRFYFSLIFVATAIMTIAVLPLYQNNFGTALRHAAFQTVSIITTTGYATTDFAYWPQICQTIIFLLMLVGGCAGSTGGGVKCSRILILFKAVRVEIRKMLYPNLVRPVKMDGKTVPDDTVRGVYAFFGAYAFLFILSMLLISLDQYQFESSFSAVLSCLNNVGPGLNEIGPMASYDHFSTLSKLVLTLDMLLGRLEIFPILLLFVPHIWKKARD